MFSLVPSTAIAFPGTELYVHMQQKGLVQNNTWMHDGKMSVLYTAEHLESELFEMHKELCSYINLDYFLLLKDLYDSCLWCCFQGIGIKYSES